MLEILTTKLHITYQNGFLSLVEFWNYQLYSYATVKIFKKYPFLWKKWSVSNLITQSLWFDIRQNIRLSYKITLENSVTQF